MDSREEPGEIYQPRWKIGLFFGVIKTTMGMGVLRTKTPVVLCRRAAHAYDRPRPHPGIDSEVGRWPRKGQLFSRGSWVAPGSGRPCFGAPGGETEAENLSSPNETTPWDGRGSAPWQEEERRL